MLVRIFFVIRKDFKSVGNYWTVPYKILLLQEDKKKTGGIMCSK